MRRQSGSKKGPVRSNTDHPVCGNWHAAGQCPTTVVVHRLPPYHGPKLRCGDGTIYPRFGLKFNANLLQTIGSGSRNGLMSAGHVKCMARAA